MTAPTAQSVSGVRQRGRIAVLLAGTVLFVTVERTLVATQNPNFVPPAILLGATIVPAAFLAFVYGRGLPYDVSATAVGITALLGGVIGTVVAATLEFDALVRVIRRCFPAPPYRAR